MTKFFEKLTRENWGFPWHIILANLATFIFFIIALAINDVVMDSHKQVSFISTAFIVFILINALGLVYELIQLKKGNENSRGAVQDIIANNSGIVIGLIEIYSIL